MYSSRLTGMFFSPYNTGIKTLPGDFYTATAQKMKLSIKDFFSKCDQILNFLRIWSHLLNKSSVENFIFCVFVQYVHLGRFIQYNEPLNY